MHFFFIYNFDAVLTIGFVRTGNAELMFRTQMNWAHEENSMIWTLHRPTKQMRINENYI